MVTPAGSVSVTVIGALLVAPPTLLTPRKYFVWFASRVAPGGKFVGYAAEEIDHAGPGAAAKAEEASRMDKEVRSIAVRESRPRSAPFEEVNTWRERVDLA
jgi:hypothetical protein